MWQDTTDHWFQYRSNPDRQSHCGVLGPRWSCVFSLCLAQLLPRSARLVSVVLVAKIMAVRGSFRYRDAVNELVLGFGQVFTGFSQTIAYA